MLKTETKTIDDLTVETTQFPAMRAFTLLGKLVKVAGPALGALSGVDASTDLTTLGPVIASALSDLDPDAATTLALEVLASTVAKLETPTGIRNVALNSRENIDLVFSSRLRTMFQVLGFAISVNYRDFIPGSAPAAPQTLKTNAA